LRVDGDVLTVGTSQHVVRESLSSKIDYQMFM
jgi:hypothetical protein